MAARNGHELGCFILPAPANIYYKDPIWIKAKCINCGMEANISEEFDLNYPCGISVRNASMEIIAMKLVRIENEKASLEGKKLPFPKRSKGVVFGKAIRESCPERKTRPGG
jgi:hypothetical protein